MRHNAAILQSTLLALVLRDNLAAVIRELQAGMAALQEISTKVSFFSTQNPLLPNRYSQNMQRFYRRKAKLASVKSEARKKV